MAHHVMTDEELSSFAKARAAAVSANQLRTLSVQYPCVADLLAEVEALRMQVLELSSKKKAK